MSETIVVKGRTCIECGCPEIIDADDKTQFMYCPHCSFKNARRKQLAAEARATELAAQLAQVKQGFQSDRLASEFTNQLVFSTLAETCEKLEAAEARADSLAAQLATAQAQLKDAETQRHYWFDAFNRKGNEVEP